MQIFDTGQVKRRTRTTESGEHIIKVCSVFLSKKLHFLNDCSNVLEIGSELRVCVCMRA